MQTAKLFHNGRSQAVRLPLAFRFDVDEVFIRRDEVTGDVILSKRPQNWDSFLVAANQLEEYEQLVIAPETQYQERDIFGDWQE